MNEVIVELCVGDDLRECAFQQAVSAFGRWREETALERHHDRTAPDLIIKTVWSEDGDLSKRLIFQEQGWADYFLLLLRAELAELAQAS